MNVNDESSGDEDLGVANSASEDEEVSNEKRAPGCFGYIGDEILPSYMGIIS